MKIKSVLILSLILLSITFSGCRRLFRPGPDVIIIVVKEK